MPDPVTRAARRQNLLDRIAETLIEWGAPADTAPHRAVAVLHFVESHGWALPVVDAPPLVGRGSTDEGRLRARVIAANTRAGCRCDPFATARALPSSQHPVGCPVRDADDAQRVTASGGRIDEQAPPGTPTPPERPGAAEGVDRC